jgi:phosphoribosylformylglycinamidine cyclo-ligase
VLPAGLAAKLDLDAMEVPGVFSWLSAAGGVSEAEMLRTFNCGTGMIVVADEASVATVSATLSACGESVTPIGSIIEQRGEAVEFTGMLKMEQ